MQRFFECTFCNAGGDLDDCLVRCRRNSKPPLSTLGIGANMWQLYADILPRRPLEWLAGHKPKRPNIVYELFFFSKGQGDGVTHNPPESERLRSAFYVYYTPCSCDTPFGSPRQVCARLALVGRNAYAPKRPLAMAATCSIFTW